MNILFVNNCKGAGVYGIELWMIRACRELAKLGHEAALACRPSQDMMAEALDHGIDAVPYKPRKGFVDWAGIRQLRRLLRDRRIDAVCVKTYQDLRQASLAAWGLPVRVFCRRGNMYDVKNDLRNYLHLVGLKPGLIVPSQALKNEFTRFSWLKPERVFVLHHGIEVDRYKEVSPALPPDDRFSAVFIGRLCHDKGVDVLLRAWAQVARRRPQARLALVGGGDQAEYAALADELGLKNLAHFAGYQPDVRPWLAASALLLLPSRREGAGYVLLEGMAAGLPVVAARLECIAEYVQDGVTGRLVPPGEVEPLAAAIEEMLSSPDRMTLLGQAGRRRAQDEFSIEAATRRLAAILAET